MNDGRRPRSRTRRSTKRDVLLQSYRLFTVTVEAPKDGSTPYGVLAERFDVATTKGIRSKARNLHPANVFSVGNGRGRVMTRIWAGMIGCASLLIASGVAADNYRAKNSSDQLVQQQQQSPGRGQPGAGQGRAKHQHHHKNGHNLLGAKLKQDGKHAVGKFKNRDVTAEVKGGKVASMAAGDLAAKRVRTKTKMVQGSGGLIQAAWDGGAFQLAQMDPYYYGYCFDDGIDYDCYWYPREDVVYESYTWDEYDPYW